MDKNDEKEFIPNKKQLKFIDLYSDITNDLNLTEICKLVGITRQTQWNWFQNPDFVDFLNETRNDILAKSQIARLKVAVREAKKGNFYFSKMLFEVEGFYLLRSKAEIKLEMEDKERLAKDLRNELGPKLAHIHEVIKRKTPLFEQKAKLEKELKEIKQEIKNKDK